MLKDQLKQIATILDKYGEKLQPPATVKAIEHVRNLVKKRFKADLPDQYINFLRTVNGLDFNGLVIYSADTPSPDDSSTDSVYGFVETNEIWRENEWQKKYLFFGDSDIGWYCLNLETGLYEEQDKPSGTVMKTFQDFDSMVESAIQRRLK
jgi:hypothetical protein